MRPRDGGGTGKSFECGGNRKAVVTTLGERFATAYFTVASWIRITNLQADRSTPDGPRAARSSAPGRGVATLLDLRQTEQLVLPLPKPSPHYNSRSEQPRNQISLLLGKNPGEVIRQGQFQRGPCSRLRYHRLHLLYRAAA